MSSIKSLKMKRNSICFPLTRSNFFCTRMIWRIGWTHPFLCIILVQFILFFILPWCKLASRARNWMKIMSPKKQRRPLPSLLYKSLFYVFNPQFKTFYYIFKSKKSKKCTPDCSPFFRHKTTPQMIKCLTFLVTQLPLSSSPSWAHNWCVVINIIYTLPCNRGIYFFRCLRVEKNGFSYVVQKNYWINIRNIVK